MTTAEEGAAGRVAKPSERAAIGLELERARRAFHCLVSNADEDDLRRPTNGTRWTNRQLLFHMLFAYLVVRALLPLVKVVSRLPGAVGRASAAVLDAATRPFNVINYWGSVAGARLYGDRRMIRKFDAVASRLEEHLATESEADLARSMAYPVRWDLFFKPVMTLVDVYHYPTQHFEFHRRQLTVIGAEEGRST